MIAPASLGTAPTSANIAWALAEAVAAHPARPAVLRHDGRTRWTFAELTDRAARIAAGFVLRGLQPGGRVALLVRDPETALVVAVATLWAGGTLVAPPVAGGWSRALLAASRTRPAVVVADPATWLVLAAVPGLTRAPIRVVTGTRHWPALATLDDVAADWHGGIVEPVPRPADGAALVSWTTGTTGPPHAVVRTHGVLAAQHAAIRKLRAPMPTDVDLVGLPTMALHDLGCGVAMVLPPRTGGRPAGARLRACVTDAAVTTAVGFPVLFERLVDGARGGSLPGLRSIHVGGAPVRQELIERLATVAPNASIVVVYGATEAEPIAAVDAVDPRSSTAGRAAGQGLLVGRPCIGIELRLAADDERAGATTARARRGRILVRGDRVAHDPVRCDADGWLDTGDLGAIDAEGRLWLLGRASNTVDGQAAAEVEEPVAELWEVRAAAVVAVSGPNGTRPVLAVEPAVGTAPAAAHARVAALAADRGWRLDRIATIRRMPRDTRSGKIDYRRLRELIR